jgi:hypothetical protein
MHALPFALPVQSVQLAPQPLVTVSATHALPTQHVAAPQTAHAPPPAPQAALVVPAEHVPCGLTAPGMQQPPLQALNEIVPQALPQTWVVRLHASSAGQSAVPLHPHTPATQAVPVALAEQFRQLAPQA